MTPKWSIRPLWGNPAFIFMSSVHEWVLFAVGFCYWFFAFLCCVQLSCYFWNRISSVPSLLCSLSTDRQYTSWPLPAAWILSYRVMTHNCPLTAPSAHRRQWQPGRCCNQQCTSPVGGIPPYNGSAVIRIIWKVAKKGNYNCSQSDEWVIVSSRYRFSLNEGCVLQSDWLMIPTGDLPGTPGWSLLRRILDWSA